MTEDLATARIKLSDPAGVIAFADVDTYTDLPSSPASQTAYRALDTGVYYKYDSGMSAWSAVDLLISDDRLQNLIDLYGINKTVQRAISIILSGLYAKRQAVKIDSGAESTQYQTLNDIIAFYNALKAEYAEEDATDNAVNTGRIGRFRAPAVGGFDL